MTPDNRPTPLTDDEFHARGADLRLLGREGCFVSTDFARLIERGLYRSWDLCCQRDYTIVTLERRIDALREAIRNIALRYELLDGTAATDLALDEAIQTALRADDEVRKQS